MDLKSSKQELKKEGIEMKILKTVFVGMVALALATAPAYAKNDKNKGNNGNENQGNSNRGNSSNAQAGQSNNGQATGQTAEKRRHTTENSRTQDTIRANRPDQAGGNNSVIRANQSARAERGTNADHSGKKEAKEKADKFFNALEHARWSYNPNDERGQGNMGKPRMRDPYGFSKDDGRKEETGNRGRPIRELLLNLAEIIGDFTMIDPYVTYLYDLLATYQRYAEQYPQYSWYTYLVNYYTSYIERYITYYSSRYTYYRLAVNRTDSIDYTLTLNTPDGFEGTNLLVTTSLISTNDYNSYTWVYNSTTRRYEYTRIHYDAGQAIMEQTQEVTLGTDSTVNFSYDPPTTLTYSGLYAELEVTVTEPESGQSYTITSDRQLYLYRCPYGKVYNAKTHQPIVGAKVTVHFEDGSIVPLDKASNPTAKNPQTTDATGRYGVKLETNRKYYITAKAVGYADYKSEVFTEKWHVLREDIALTPLEEVASK